MQKLTISGVFLQKFSYCASLLAKISFKLAPTRQSYTNFWFDFIFAAKYTFDYKNIWTFLNESFRRKGERRIVEIWAKILPFWRKVKETAQNKLRRKKKEEGYKFDPSLQKEGRVKEG